MRRRDFKFEGRGDCFRYSYDRAKRGGALVHADVTDPWSEKVYPHAWVEDRGKVFDWQTEQGLGKGPRLIADFYRLYRPTNIKRYSLIDAQKRAVGSRHYGPWEDNPPSGRRDFQPRERLQEGSRVTKTIHIKSLPPGTDLSGGYDELKRWGDVMALVDADGFDPETVERRYIVRPSDVPAQERLQRVRADVKYGNKSYTEQPFYYYDNRSPSRASQGQFEDAVIYLIPVGKFSDLTDSEDSAIQKILRNKGYREAWKYPLTAPKWKKILAMDYMEARDHADYEIANAVDSLGSGWDFPGVYALTKKGAIKWVVSRNREGGGL